MTTAAAAALFQRNYATAPKRLWMKAAPGTGQASARTNAFLSQ